MSAMPTGRAWIELDMENLRHNCEVIQKLLPDGCRLMPALKANAYGHGAVLIARELNAIGIRAFCVASLEEGVMLRRNGIKGVILILGYTHSEDFYLLRKYRLTQTVLDAGYAEQLDICGYKIHVHIAVDTGMHRLGERCDNIDEIIGIFKCSNLVIDGMYTHLCAADSSDQRGTDYTNMQIEAFYELVSLLKAEGIKSPMLHIQSSYGIMNYPNLKCDYARIGIALYGLLSTRADTENCCVDLRPVLSVKARVSAIKKLSAGESAGYGLQFTAPCDMKIAVISIGYADGIPRTLSCGKGCVIIDGERVPIIGRICMDQLTVDVTDIPSVKRDDIAVIIGNSRNSQIATCELAEKADTISNEILSRLGERLTRICVY
ncbi:MAG: serine racemase VanT catalytic subunit [Oscillospiraceae bacterium]|nr:serine racemase VanT catalytic subunit [Oscillospiraceae bacterium]